ncbi:unnamed protein product, partial [Heterosigma akashiwo]
LTRLKKSSNVVIDTADIDLIKTLAESGLQDVTTNPSLVRIAAEKYKGITGISLENCLVPDDLYELTAMEFGKEILKVVSGWVCIQLDIQNSDDTFMIAFRARQLIETYEASGIPRDRIMIKLASTWEGIRACEQLEKEGIRCLMTLTVSEVQGRAAADAGASMIATYVGRVGDWHREQDPSLVGAPAEEDAGVRLTWGLQDYYRRHGYRTQVMAASFRSVEQVFALEGCDQLTIGPVLLKQL